MTGLNDSQIPHDPQQPREYHRERLSAMMDGTLSADEARFLLRRMEHDDELADCWQRWQCYGDAMRGHAGRALPADFAQRVGRAIAEDAAETQRQAEAAPARARRPFAYWRGVAVAASVALVAVVGSRLMIPVQHAPASLASAADGALPAAPAAPRLPVPMPVPVSPAPAGNAAAQAAGAALVAVAANGEARKRHFYASARPLAESPASLPAVAQAAERRAAAPLQLAANETQRRESQVDDGGQVRSWPKALVPGLSGSDAIVDLRVDGGPAPANRGPRFVPFEPAAAAGGDAPRP